MHTLRSKIEPLAQIASVPEWWDPLFLSASNASAFLSSGWISSWLESYGAAFTGDWISMWDDDRCVAGCLLLSRPGRAGPFPVRLAVINTALEDAEESPWVEYNDVLCVAGYEDEVAAAVIDVVRRRKWDQLYLSGFIDGGVMSRLRRPVAGAVFESVVKPSPYVDLTRAAGSAETLLSSNSRAQVKRSMKLYSQRGALRIEAASTADEAKSYLSELALLHREGWKRRGKKGGLRTDEFLDFHRRLIDRLWSVDGVAMLRASAGKDAIGYLYSFLHDGKVYFYQSGFSYEEDPKLKPGLVAHCLAIDYFRSRGIREYDFMAGDARYKASLANASRQLVWARVERPTLRMHVVRSARAVKHALVSQKQSDHAVAQE